MIEINFVVTCEKAFFADETKTLNLIGIFDRITSKSGTFPLNAKFSIATSIKADIGRHKQQVTVEKEGDSVLLLKDEVDIDINEVGQSAQTVIEVVNITFPNKGIYSIRVKVDDDESSSKEAKIVIL